MIVQHAGHIQHPLAEQQLHEGLVGWVRQVGITGGLISEAQQEYVAVWQTGRQIRIKSPCIADAVHIVVAACLHTGPVCKRLLQADLKPSARSSGELLVPHSNAATPVTYVAAELAAGKHRVY